jgi:hypothetical protein
MIGKNMQTSTILSLLRWCFWLSVVAGSDIDYRVGSLRGSDSISKLDVIDRELQTMSTIQFRLVNSVTDLPIADITPKSIAYIGSVAASSLTIEVVVKGRQPGSVKMSLTGAIIINRTEGGTKFALCGNSGSNLFPCTKMIIGKYILKADLLAGALGTGQLFQSAAVDFELRSGTKPQPTAPVPVALPVTPPVKQPVTPPVSPPVKSPIQSPILAPVVLPTSCAVPKVRTKTENQTQIEIHINTYIY